MIRLTDEQWDRIRDRCIRPPRTALPNEARY